MVLVAFISVIVSIFTNVYLILPFYMKLYEMDWDAIIEIFTNINPVITNIPTIIIFSVVPFNVVSRVLTSLITLVLYKKVSRLIKE